MTFTCEVVKGTRDEAQKKRKRCSRGENLKSHITQVTDLAYLQAMWKPSCEGLLKSTVVEIRLQMPSHYAQGLIVG
jgi:hypothetical protein